MNCDKCGRLHDGETWYHLAHQTITHHFCSRRCLVEFIAPELARAVVVKHWIPTPEEEPVQ
jgi:hypothetical protein